MATPAMPEAAADTPGAGAPDSPAVEAAIARVSAHTKSDEGTARRQRVRGARALVKGLLVLNALALIAAAVSGAFLAAWYRTPIIEKGQAPALARLTAENLALVTNVHWGATIALVVTAIGVVVFHRRFVVLYRDTPVPGAKPRLWTPLGTGASIALVLAVVLMALSGLHLPERPDVGLDLDRLNRTISKLRPDERQEAARRFYERQFGGGEREIPQLVDPQDRAVYAAHGMGLPIGYTVALLVLLIVLSQYTRVALDDAPSRGKSRSTKGKPKLA